MSERLSRLWWLLVLRGAFAVLFGLLALVWPGITLLALVLLFGVYAIVDGVTALGTAVSGRARGVRLETADRTWLGVQGVLGVGAGVVAFAWPGITELALLVVIGVWALVLGITLLVAAVRLRRAISNEWLLASSGVVSLLFGVALLAQPGAGALALVWLIGTFAIVFGVATVAAGLRLRGAAGVARPMAAPSG